MNILELVKFLEQRNLIVKLKYEINQKKYELNTKLHRPRNERMQHTNTKKKLCQARHNL